MSPCSSPGAPPPALLVAEQPRRTSACTSSLRALGRPRSALLQDAHLDTLPLGQRPHRRRALADDEDVSKAGGEGVAGRVLQVHNVKAALVPLARDDDADTPGV